MSQPANLNNRPLPPEIYRRRRLAALAGIVVVLVALAFIVRAIAGGGGSEDTTATAGSATLSSAAGEPSTSSSRTSGSATEATMSQSGAASSSSHRSSDSAAASASEEPGAQCSLDDLLVAARAGAPTYGADQLPDFYLTLTNQSNAGCTVDTAANPMSFEVFTLTNYTRVWADTDCNDPASAENITLRAGESRSFALNGWSRTTSAPGVCADRAPAGTGAFLLYGHLGGKTSEPETFNLA